MRVIPKEKLSPGETGRIYRYTHRQNSIPAPGAGEHGDGGEDGDRHLARRSIVRQEGDRDRRHTINTSQATMSNRQAGGFYNRSLERALQILDAFSRERQVLTRAQLSEILGLPLPTISRLCSTLVQYGYLAKDRESKQYSLGMRLFEQGSIVFYSFSLRAAASHHLTELQKETGQTVFLGVLDNGQLLYIDKRENEGSIISFTSKIGTRRPPYWGMCGPLLMSYLPDSEIEGLLEKTPLNATTRKSITDKEKFKAWLNQIRDQGVAVDPEATFEGITGVAAPVRDSTGGVVAAVGIALMSSSLGPNGIRKIAQKVLKTAEAISGELGYRSQR